MYNRPPPTSLPPSHSPPAFTCPSFTCMSMLYITYVLITICVCIYWFFFKKLVWLECLAMFVNMPCLRNKLTTTATEQQQQQQHLHQCQIVYRIQDFVYTQLIQWSSRTVQNWSCGCWCMCLHVFVCTSGELGILANCQFAATASSCFTAGCYFGCWLVFIQLLVASHRNDISEMLPASPDTPTWQKPSVWNALCTFCDLLHTPCVRILFNTARCRKSRLIGS